MRASFALPRLGVGPHVVAVVLIAGLLVAIALQPTRQLIDQRKRIDDMVAEYEKLRATNEALSQRIQRLQDPDFIEQEARAQIGLVRPGETAYVVMPPGKRERIAAKRKRAAARARPPVPPPPSFIESLLTFAGL